MLAAIALLFMEGVDLPLQWDNIQIAQHLDRRQRDVHGGGPAWMNGLEFMQGVSGSNIYDHPMAAGFVRELTIMRDLGLLEFKVQGDADRWAVANPEQYLQMLWDFALTVAGQDRARGRVVVQSLPDPAEDDGRPISDLILRQVAAAITTEYAPDEVLMFLAEAGLPPSGMTSSGQELADARDVLATSWRWGSEGRRAVRQFVGRWLADHLLSGPDAETRAQLIAQLGRQGWAVRADDGMLAIAEPTRASTSTAGFLRASRLHPLIEAEARDQFLINKPDQGVFGAMRAVEVRVRRLAGLEDSAIGVDLMNKAFGPSGPLVDLSAVKGEQEGTRALFAGAYAVLRNPAGHRYVNYDDISEASEAVQTASLLMRILDRVEDQLLSTARNQDLNRPGSSRGSGYLFPAPPGTAAA